jgi:carbon storage regulator CsrA
MLKLKRRREQSVKIGPDVVVTILAISPGDVTLAITAPPSLKIIRSDGAHFTDKAVVDKAAVDNAGGGLR